MHVVDFNLKFGLSNVKTLDVMLPHPFLAIKGIVAVVRVMFMA